MFSYALSTISKIVSKSYISNGSQMTTSSEGVIPEAHFSKSSYVPKDRKISAIACLSFCSLVSMAHLMFCLCTKFKDSTPVSSLYALS